MPHINSPCDTCPAYCCRNYHLVINGYDAYRISSTLKIPMHDFCELRWLGEAEGEYKIILDGRNGVAERRFHRLVIKKVPDPDPQYEEGRCTFLISVGDRGRCGVYDVRPGMCGTYPSSYYNGLVTFNNGGKYCPPNAWQVETIDVPVFRLRHLRHNRQKVLWEGLIDGWNERLLFEANEIGDRYFYYFLTNAYRALSERDPSLFDDANANPPEPVEHLLGLVDQVLRELGWRTDATVHGRSPPPSPPIADSDETATTATATATATETATTMAAAAT